MLSLRFHSFFLSSCYVVSGRTIRTRCLMRRRISDNSRSSRNSCRRLRSSRGNCTLSSSSCRTAVDQVKPHLVLFLWQLFPKHTTTNQLFHPSTAKKNLLVKCHTCLFFLGQAKQINHIASIVYQWDSMVCTLQCGRLKGGRRRGIR